MKTLVLGLGNPILRDDGVGFHVIEQLRTKLDGPDLTFKESSSSGLSLLDLITGYDKLIIVDAIKSGKGPAGRIYRFVLDDFKDTLHTGSPHQANLATVIELGRRLGERLPQQVNIFAIEAVDINVFGEDCTPRVKQAVPKVVDMVIKELSRGCY